jgi:hypothetical protein
MRTKLRVAALLLAVIATAWWFFAGHPRGWWFKTKVPYMEKDPVTDQEVERFEDRFVPGIDCLAAGLLLSAGLAGISFIVGRKAEAKDATAA